MCHHSKLLSLLSSSKVSLTFCFIARRSRDSDTHTASVRILVAASLSFSFLSLILCISVCVLPKSRCSGFQRHVWLFFGSLDCEFWYCTNLILFDVSPQGFKGKTGHVGFPGQKVSQQLIALSLVCLYIQFLAHWDVVGSCLTNW